MTSALKTRRSILHVGFAHSGTTSLQHNFFSQRPDFFYCGLPYGDCGGIFSFIKYQTDRQWDKSLVESLCQSHMWDKATAQQILVVSDETLVEQPEVYHTPCMLPGRTIASRLQSLFPNATILFTIRNQFDYVVSSYLNLKRNYARLNMQRTEEFDAWFSGNHTQVANLFLRNLDYSDAVKDYLELFGRNNVVVLPLEMVQREGVGAFLARLGNSLDVPISQRDIDKMSVARNRRMTVLEEAVANLWPEADFRRVYDALATSLGETTVSEPLKAAEPARIVLSEQQRETIRSRVTQGNQFIAETFGIPLLEYGYP